MKREIVLGYDPEHGGKDVLDLGRLFAEVLAAKPHVVTALPWPDYLVGVGDFDKQLEADTHEQFAVVHDELDDLGVEAEAVASRTPASTLQQIAESSGAEMIVVGSCHHGPVGRTLAGSVGESLLHGASCPVAIAPRDYAERGQERLQRVAVAFDGSSESWTALETAIGIAERCHATVTVIAVADYPRYGYASLMEHHHDGRVRGRRARRQGTPARLGRRQDPERNRTRESRPHRRPRVAPQRGQ